MISKQQLEQGGVKPNQSCYNPRTCSKPISFTQGVISANAVDYKNLISKSISKAKAKAVAVKKHCDAERRRRLRINGQYAALRNILPNLFKMDKASVLGETIRTVRELQTTVKALKEVCQVGEECVFPIEADELSLHCPNGDEGLLKASLSCEEKPGLMSDLTRALRSVKGRMVRAEMVIVGGRTKCVLWVQGIKGNELMGRLEKALNLVIDRPVPPGNSNNLCYYQ